MKEEQKSIIYVHISGSKSMLHIYTVWFFFFVYKNQLIRTSHDTNAHYWIYMIWSERLQKRLLKAQSIAFLIIINWFQVDASPARWCVWISSRPVRVLRDLRSLKATTGTMSSSLVSPSCKVLVPTGSLAATSMVPLCTGCVFSFGWAAFGKLLTGAVFCRKKHAKHYQLSQEQTVWLWKNKTG